jgi:eukaryotic-like serine/threonine-protein kinase
MGVPSPGATRLASRHRNHRDGGARLDSFKDGDVICDKYEVTGTLGEGGMGKVLAARHRELDRKVALKFLHASLRGDPEACARFTHEARATSRLENEHVARVYDVDKVEGVPFIAMEHLTGRDLGAELEERGQLPFKECADLLLQACEAIDEAHALGIVHRDLKPANLFVTKRNGTPFIKVLDFGISKSTAAGDMSVTAHTGFLGSPSYMSPEQLTNPRSVDARSDVWALGVILYEMITGTMPFEGETVAAVATAILTGPYPSASEHRPGIPPGLADTIADALEKNRDERLPSVEAFAARVASYGTDVARASYDRIRRSASGSHPPSEGLPEPGAQKAPPSRERGGETLAKQITGITDAPVVDVDGAAKTATRPMRWRPLAALGVVVAAAALTIALPRLRQARHAATADSATLATVESTPSGTASAPLPIPSTGGQEVAPAMPATSSSAALPTPADETRPAARAETTGPTSAEARIAAVQPAVTSSCSSGATADCEAACAANNPGSCTKLADALFKGTGAPKNAARAASLYQKACDGGSVSACNNLGVRYAVGDGVSKDALRAVGLYKRACELGDARACVNLGAMHYNGDGVAKDYALGVSFFSRGCEAGDANGCNFQSIAYGTGRGTSPDNASPQPERSFELAGRACKMGAGAGCIRVEEARVKGLGVDKDAKTGLAELDAMCTKRQADACASLAKIYANGSGPDVPADPLRGREYLKKACDFGSTESCGYHGLAGNIDNGRSNIAQISATLQSNCDKGNATACAMLAENLLKGNATNEDRAKATALLQKACTGGYDPACKRLAGSGTP